MYHHIMQIITNIGSGQYQTLQREHLNSGINFVDEKAQVGIELNIKYNRALLFRVPLNR